MVVAGPSDNVIVKDVYEKEGTLKPTNTYVEKSAAISDAQEYIKPKVSDAQQLEWHRTAKKSSPAELKALFAKGYNPYTALQIQHVSVAETAAEVEVVRKTKVNKMLATPAAKDAKSRLTETIGGGYGNLDTLSDTLKTSLIGEVLSGDKATDLSDLYSRASAAADDITNMSTDDIISQVAGTADALTGGSFKNTLVQLEGVDKIINCDPTDLVGMQSMLEDLTGNANIMGIVDIGAITGAMSTVLKCANEWGLPGLVDIGLGAVKDKELKLKMLKNATLSASLKGDINLTKYYARKLEKEGDSIIGGIADADKYALNTISDKVCLNLLTRYRIAHEDEDKDFPTLGNELLAYLSHLNPNWAGDINTDPFLFQDFCKLSKDARKVVLYTDYAAPAAVIRFCKQTCTQAIIRDTFPHLSVLW